MEQKAVFLKKDLFVVLNDLSSSTASKWGRMNAHQMLEHVAHFFDVSTGRRIYDVVTPAEHLPKYKEFLFSEKQFRENTKAPANILGEEPMPLETASLEEAKKELEESVAFFFEYFKDKPTLITTHPAFGPLNFDEWVLLHYKHVAHHLRQFGLMN